ncbi:MAG: hypothetical protein JXR70_08265 [Spirochaetales bacterium]|nr:hypothetical protein [Spirochaetales bacterium]
MKKLIIMACCQSEAERAVSYFTQAAYQVLPIYRESLVKEQKLIISDKQVVYGQEDLLENTAGLVILEEDYMWPQPSWLPDEEQWPLWQSDMDNQLRNQREGASFWFSLMDILCANLPVAVNSREGREAAIFQPMALTLLKEQGFSLLPFLLTNHHKELRDFCSAHRGSVFSMSLADPLSAVEVSPDKLKASLEAPSPYVYQLSDGPDVIHLHHCGKSVFGAADSGLEQQTLAMAEFLKLQMGLWQFRKYKGQWALAAFSSLPRWAELGAAEVPAFFKALDDVIQGAL